MPSRSRRTALPSEVVSIFIASLRLHEPIDEGARPASSASLAITIKVASIKLYPHRSVIFGMAPEEPNYQHPRLILQGGNHPIVVSRDVEHDPAGFEDTRSRVGGL